MTIAIVDAYATGADLQRALDARGAACVHVASDAVLPASFLAGFPRDRYLQTFDSQATPYDELVAGLQALQVSAVTPGTESGVELAERLARSLGLPGNDPATSADRRDKQRMIDRARAAGLRVPASATFDSVEVAHAWIAEQGLQEVVVKPAASAGTDNVRFCRSREELDAAASAVLSSRNIVGHDNVGFVVQERLLGTEWYCNTVSVDGRHHVAEIWRYHKSQHPSGSPVYEYDEPCDPAHPLTQRCVEYCCAVLDALDIREGAAHTEVMVGDDGPVLIETNARLGGGTAPDVIERYFGISQTSLLADTLLDRTAPVAPRDRVDGERAQLLYVALKNPRGGVAADTGLVEAIEALPTAVHVMSRLVPGRPAPETTNLLTCPGWAYLAAADPGELHRDMARIRDLEFELGYTA